MRPFASSTDLDPKRQVLETIADGVYALTGEGDPNVGAVEGEDFVVCIEAMATPVAASAWIDQLRTKTDKPIRYLVLTHYHAVRTLGAAAFDATEVIAHETTAKLIDERGREDWLSELGRMPRLFQEPDSISDLTRPDITFSDRLTIPLGGDRGELVLEHCGRGHTAGDVVAWLPKQRVMFAGDLVEAEAALYTGDAFHREWSSTTLDRVAAFEPMALVGGRGPVVHGRDGVTSAIEQTRGFLAELLRAVGETQERGGTLRDAFQAAHAALSPRYGHWPIFEHCLPFDVARTWEELSGVEWPTVWTEERDRRIWAELQG